MRSLEALLLFVNLLTFVMLSIRPPGTARWMRRVAFVAVMTGFAHWLVEGLRWQMAPSYALTVLLLMISMRAPGAVSADSAGRRVVQRIAINLGALGLAVAFVLPMLAPVFRFPHPAGPYAIGTLTYHWIDKTRSEVFTADPEQHRQLMVQIWYPAEAHPSAPRTAYLADAGAVTAAFARIHGMPEFVFGHFRYVTTNAVSAVPAAQHQVSYPVLLFLEGATGFRQMNTYQVEELVTHGYIVVAIDQPGTAANVVFPDGRQSMWASPDPMPLIRQSYLPAASPPTLNGRTYQDGIVRYLAQDAIVTMDKLAGLNQSDPNGILTGKLDLQRIGAFGVSLGGIVVGEACRLDPRLRACLVMDAPMSADVVKAGLRQPGMWITRDAASMRLERQRAGGWPEAEIEAHQTSMRAVYDGLSGSGYFVQVPGMFHSNFTDVPNWSPLAPWLELTGPIDAQRAHNIVNAYSLAFFDLHLRGVPARLLEGVASRYPEVLFETRRRP